MLKAVIVVNLISSLSLAFDPALYYDGDGLTVGEVGGKIKHVYDEKRWKHSKEGPKQIYIRKEKDKFSEVGRAVNQTVIVTSKDGETQYVNARKNTFSIPGYINDYEVSDGKTYLKKCGINSDTGEKVTTSECNLVSQKLCARMYADTMKMTTSELDKCSTLINVLGRFHSEAMRDFNAISHEGLKSNFPETAKIETKPLSNNLWMLGSMCRELRCLQGDGACMSQTFLPTSDNPIPSAVPVKLDSNNR